MSSDMNVDSYEKNKGSWWRRIRWFNFIMLVILPLGGFLQAMTVKLQLSTFVLSVIYYFLTTGSITAGYHRLWAHRSYAASSVLKWTLALFGAGAVQGSIKFWAREHRAHHRFTDTDRDPYNIQQGLLHAHILWVIIEQPRKNNRVNISDLNNDPVVAFQHKYYVFTALFMGWALPAVVAGLGWGDWYGGFLYASLLRSFFVNQATFCVNSIAHYMGDQPFDDNRSPRDHFITALITMGEGYHNFHHEFPSDYRNGIEWWQLDITKWSIAILGRLGLAHNLKRFRHNEIEKGRLQQLYKKLDRRVKSLDWGRLLGDLPVLRWNEFKSAVEQEGQSLIVIEGVVHDVTEFIHEHPGGENFMHSALGQDATQAFNGGVYSHSNAARNLLSTFRVAVLYGGGEVEVMK